MARASSGAALARALERLRALTHFVPELWLQHGMQQLSVLHGSPAERFMVRRSLNDYEYDIKRAVVGDVRIKFCTFRADSEQESDQLKAMI